MIFDSLGDKYSFKNAQNIWSLFGLFKNITLKLKTSVVIFGQPLVEIGLLYNLTLLATDLPILVSRRRSRARTIGMVLKLDPKEAMTTKLKKAKKTEKVDCHILDLNSRKALCDILETKYTS